MKAGIEISYDVIVDKNENKNKKRDRDEDFVDHQKTKKKQDHAQDEAVSTQSSKSSEASNSKVKAHPTGKCAGCGDNYRWQIEKRYTSCEQNGCAFRDHPDYNSTDNWAQSDIAKQYSKVLDSNNKLL